VGEEDHRAMLRLRLRSKVAGKGKIGFPHLCARGRKAAHRIVASSITGPKSHHHLKGSRETVQERSELRYPAGLVVLAGAQDSQWLCRNHLSTSRNQERSGINAPKSDPTN
jgi:hypothetical protein